MQLQEIIDNFEFLDDWEDRYRYIIELGRNLETFPEDQRTDENKVRGCASQVWLVTKTDKQASPDDPILNFIGDSDAHIVSGLIAIILAVYSGKSASQILQIDAKKILDDLDLSEHLSQQRSNGLASMVARIHRDAEQASA